MWHKSRRGTRGRLCNLSAECFQQSFESLENLAKSLSFYPSSRCSTYNLMASGEIPEEVLYDFWSSHISWEEMHTWPVAQWGPWLACPVSALPSYQLFRYLLLPGPNHCPLASSSSCLPERFCLLALLLQGLREGLIYVCTQAPPWLVWFSVESHLPVHKGAQTQKTNGLRVQPGFLSCAPLIQAGLLVLFSPSSSMFPRVSWVLIPPASTPPQGLTHSLAGLLDWCGS